MHGLLLPFDTDNPEFVRGFEAGRVWGKLMAEPSEPMDFFMHTVNAEMALRLGEATGRRCRCEEKEEPWMLVYFDAAEE